MCKYYFPPVTFIQIKIKNKYKSSYRKQYVSYDKISKYAKIAVIAAEDATFKEHNGFSWIGIEKAMVYNKKHPGKLKGGSTISQQVAKNVFLWNSRTWFRKSLEVYFTTMIEFVWGKKRILETYLNVIEMGPGIIGVEAAAHFFYHKEAKYLTIEESAMLASCLPNPKFLNPLNPSPMLVKKYTNVLNRMKSIVESRSLESLL